MLNKEASLAFKAISGIEKFYTDPGDCYVYGYDNSRRQVLPDAVIFPQTHQHVVTICEICNQYKIPLTVRGRGTATTGATVPVEAGLVVSMEQMNKVISFQPENRLIIVEPGITNQEVQEHVKAKGFFWAPDPSSSAFCSVGGNIACNAAGPRAVKYGTTRDHILGLTSVTGDAKTLVCGVKTTKGVVGYDFTRLITGSEGTLAIITQATLKLLPLPETKQTIQVIFDSIASATRAITALMSQPIIPCALEFIDKNAINMIRDYSSAYLPEQAQALLMIEIDGSKDCIDQQALCIEKTVKQSGCLEYKVAQTKEEINELWKTRKALSPALRKIAPKKINEDIVVPVANIPTLLEQIEQLAHKYDIAIVNFGHAGNGNIHVNLLTNPDDPEKLTQAYQCLEDLFKLVLKLDGTLSGEHGIGLEKKDYIHWELGETNLQLMKSIKQQFDPNNILNPGKI
ncbi:MAG: FAD-linked oxidase C-terminal domain-containing protein [Pseudomonadota bacterium]